MPNIKEIALKVAEERFPQLPEEVLDFADALIAELAKGNEPEIAAKIIERTDILRAVVILNSSHYSVGTEFYLKPPTASQIEQETAEACAQACEAKKSNWNYCAEAIRSGAWKEFK